MVDILLATYNGGRYIETQLLSIISQSYKNWRLIIHDDGSTDNTIEIVKRWVKLDNRISLIEDNIRCGGAAQNFMHLLNYSNAAYVMFCDQDDIWLDNKVELMYNRITSMDTAKPRVVYSNSYVWKPDEGIGGLATLSFPSSLNELLFMNSGVQGCVSIFDDKVRELMKVYKGVMSMHDHVLNLIAASMADVSIIHVPLMLYRNHNSNVTGDTRTKILVADSLTYRGKLPVVDNLHYDTIQRFRLYYSDNLSLCDKRILDDYLTMPQKGFIYRLFVIISNKYKLYNSVLLLIVKLFFRPFKR